MLLYFISHEFWMMQELATACTAAMEAVTSKCQALTVQRKPLQRKAGAKAAAVKLFNPRFEDDFVAGKDYDPDRRVN